MMRLEHEVGPSGLLEVAEPDSRPPHDAGDRRHELVALVGSLDLLLYRTAAYRCCVPSLFVIVTSVRARCRSRGSLDGEALGLPVRLRSSLRVLTSRLE
jgi:hypothetical protein